MLLMLLVVFLAGACLPERSPQQEARPVEIEAPILSDDFDDAFTYRWNTYNVEGAFIGIENGVLTMLTSVPGRLLRTTNGETYDNVVLETGLAFRTDYEQSFGGLLCRTDLGTQSRGYYFLISADGAFSIRRGTQTGLEALVPWQNHRAIYTDGRRNRLRAVCVGDTLSFYVNDTYLDGATDDRFSSGSVGFTLGLPGDAPTAVTASVEFDNLAGWEAIPTE